MMTKLNALVIGAAVAVIALPTLATGPAQATETTSSSTPGVAVINVFKNRHTGACVDSDDNGNAYARPCNGGNYQNWEIIDVGGATRELKNEETELCLDDSDYFGLKTHECNKQQFQRWDRIAQPNGISLRNLATGRCLDDSERGLRTIECNNLNYQIWW